MVEVEVDGKKVSVTEGSMVMTAATQAGAYVPHFCYHKKLSIAANCRMCLVEVEKAPKPLPACATPVAQGMKIHTHSEKAISAQKGVMEFLLINHPLDCPICDQGGECQLQDLAVGYGSSSSNYEGTKRVVFHKPLGPLISAQEMSRCIHCTRCVRFGQEVAGVMELGMAGRGEHSEIMSFVGRSIDSELSGNMIDVCPVGALTSKPFRYSARTWELTRRKSIAPHDSLGSNITVQVKANKVMRVLPLENDAINECWLSDQDRFSYEGLNTDDRLTEPKIKQDGQWQTVSWQTALEYVAQTLTAVKNDGGAAGLGFLANASSSLEELGLLGQLARGLGSDNVDFRLRQTDFSLAKTDSPKAIPWLGMKISEISQLNRVLFVGAHLRQEQPLLTARIRQAAKRALKVNTLHCIEQDLLMPVANQLVLAPSEWTLLLGQIIVAACEIKTTAVPAYLTGTGVSAAAAAIAKSMCSGDKVAVLLGNGAAHHAQFVQLRQLAQTLAQVLGGTHGILGEAGNSVGGYIAKAVPQSGGLSASAMLASPLRAYVLLNMEPAADVANPVQALKSLVTAKSVVALTPYTSPDLLDLADCLLPITPFTEMAATYVNTEGRIQSTQAVVAPLGQARPGWKVLRVLGNLLQLPGFNADSSDDVRRQVLGAASTDPSAEFVSGLDNGVTPLTQAPTALPVADHLTMVPAYGGDNIVRRAQSLQQTTVARKAAKAASATGFV
jgi:NADH-quinone oxidoreductase subunit G